MGFMFWIPHLNNDFVCHMCYAPLDHGTRDEYRYKSTTFCNRLFVTVLAPVLENVVISSPEDNWISFGSVSRENLHYPPAETVCAPWFGWHFYDHFDPSSKLFGFQQSMSTHRVMPDPHSCSGLHQCRTCSVFGLVCFHKIFFECLRRLSTSSTLLHHHLARCAKPAV